MPTDNLGWAKIGLAIVCLMALVWVWMPRAKYPKVSSEDGDRMIRLLATSCGSKNKELLQKAKDEMSELTLTDVERSAFNKIIETAEMGDWKAAHRASIQFAEDQVR